MRNGISIPLCIILSMCMAALPFGQCHPVLDKQFNDGMVMVGRQMAYADDVATNKDFIEHMASYGPSGLSSSQFVAAYLASCAVATGINLADGTISMNKTLDENLAAIQAGGTWPDYSSLSAEDQAEWSDVNEYNAAKFNDLVIETGTVERSNYNNFMATGGGSFADPVLSRVREIGQFAQDWSMGKDVLFGQIYNVFGDNAKENVQGWLPKPSGNVQVDGNGVEDWPEGVDKNFLCDKSNIFEFRFDSSYRTVGTTIDVYCYASKKTGSQKAVINMISTEPFNYGQNLNSNGYVPVNNYNGSATKSTLAGGDYYWAGVSVSKVFTERNFFYYDVVLTTAQEKVINNAILYGGATESGGSDSVLDGYPTVQIGPNVQIVFPGGGVKSDTPWDDFLSEQQKTNDTVTGIRDLLENLMYDDDGCLKVFDSHIYSVVSQMTFYNSGQLMVHDEGIYDSLTDIGNMIGDIQNILSQILNAINTPSSDVPDLVGEFDFPALEERSLDLVDTISSLAPFGALLGISEIFSVISYTGAIPEPVMTFSFDFMPGQHYDVEIDMSWMDGVKPVINYCMIGLLVLSLFEVTYRLVELEAAS